MYVSDLGWFPQISHNYTSKSKAWTTLLTLHDSVPIEYKLQLCRGHTVIFKFHFISNSTAKLRGTVGY
jgi:hypothetical protein